MVLKNHRCEDHKGSYSLGAFDHTKCTDFSRMLENTDCHNTSTKHNNAQGGQLFTKTLRT